MRFTHLVLLLGPTIPGSAQNWCAPGAAWTYHNTYMGYTEGLIVMSFTGDTMLDGFQAQVIGSLTINHDMITEETDTLVSPVHVITRVDGDIVFYWGYDVETWDTLYNFGAAPGEGWQPPYASPGLCGGAEYGDMVQVLDTGTMVIDGVALHYLDIQNGLYGGRITERLGWSLMMFIFEGCWQIECDCGLMCYHDDQIDHLEPGVLQCDIATALAEAPVPDVVLVPNPGTDHFSVALPPGAHLIRVLDLTGRVVQFRPAMGPRVNIDAASLSTGLYMVRIDEGACVRWLKE